MTNDESGRAVQVERLVGWLMVHLVQKVQKVQFLKGAWVRFFGLVRFASAAERKTTFVRLDCGSPPRRTSRTALEDGWENVGRHGKRWENVGTAQADRAGV